MKRWPGMRSGDKILIAFLVICIIGGYIVNRFINVESNKKNVVIKVDDNVIKTLTVNEKTDNKIYDFQFKNNTGYIELKDGKVRMLEMIKDICPEGVCSDTGWISKKYETIVCLPNKIIIFIEQNKEGDVDAVAY
ncbi:hypothetical protein OXPF_23910 [Oxobacter pfennigii]|uniref:Uncharacterized protein n=1 Tax=Oxobacter pfennigii TaxID=36849 RepID=A0A0P8W943_9CLOT|nr:NusG domain II-containing protein [Oxobacter pfennigii]KPU44223.1 hypothetical protein OXPF_23910 [Oxobacter pfennigii]